MLPRPKNSIRLFRVAGIDVFLNWTWFLVAFFLIRMRAEGYSSYAWGALEYLSLFAIVLMHEFGHALACRSVGGRADLIVLWPLGGVAYVDPPPRPGATLWSLAAGPLVNVVLFPILTVLWYMGGRAHWALTMPNFYHFVTYLWVVDLGLLCFNMLPLYPLDGGQILRCLIWYATGRARSLMIATVMGLVAVPLLLLLAAMANSRWLNNSFDSIWLLVMGGFAFIRCWSGFKQARILAKLEASPRHTGLACPSCRKPPLAGDLWLCAKCGQAFDMFASGGICPKCGAVFAKARCFDCGRDHSIAEYSQG
ncbi:MAG TPA: site-2 protease family protein [Verrucomicrobiae bacterium]|jgi:Zn-dependent protease